MKFAANYLVQGALLYLLLIPSIVLFGWSINNVYLMRVVPSLTPMNPVSAICFMLSTFCLWGLTQKNIRAYRPVFLFAGSIIMVVGFVMLLKYLFGLDFQIDRLFFVAKMGTNRMAPNSALNFTLLGLAILLFDVRVKRFRPAELLILVSLSLAGLALVGYAYNLVNLYGLPSYIPMAVHTALSFIVLGIALLAARPKTGIIALFSSEGIITCWFLSLKLRAKLLTVFGIVIGFLLLFSGIVLANLSNIQNVQLPAQTQIREATSAFVAMRLQEKDFLNRSTTDHAQQIKNWQDSYQTLQLRLETLSQAGNSAGDTGKALVSKGFINELSSYHDSFLQVVDTYSVLGSVPSLLLIEQMNADISDVNAQINSLRFSIEDKTGQKLALMYRLVISLAFLLSLLGLVFAILVSNQLTTSLVDLEEAAKALARGQLGKKVVIRSNDEIGKVANTFNQMAAALSLSQSSLEIGNKKLEANINQLEKSKSATLNILEDLQISKQKVQEERAKDEAIISSIGDGVFVVDQKFRIILFNQSASLISGFSSAEVVGKLYDDVLSFVDEKTGLSQSNFVRESIENGGLKEILTNSVLIRKNGERVVIANTSSQVKDDTGRIIGCVVVFRDVTHERAIDQAKTEFVSLASHQLRTPLSAINWYSEMLLAGDAGPINDEQKLYLEEVYSGNKRMVNLVNALLNVSRIDLGTFSVDPVPTKITEIADSVLVELTSQIKERKQDVEIEYDTDIPELLFDPKLVRIILQNLLSNAVKYTPEKGRIRLGITREGKHLICITVADTGYGIPRTQKSRIFSKLFRADNVMEKDTEGTGLGLYIVKSIVETTGGSIRFTSTENKGTTFYVTLPASGMQKKEGVKGLG